MRGSHGDGKILARARSLRALPTDAENRMWSHLRNRRFAGLKFNRQYAIGPYFADFVCREEWLVIELDGGQHAESKRDEIRTLYINAIGYSVLRFWNTDVLKNMDGVLTVIQSVLDGHPTEDTRFSDGNLHARPR